MEPKRLYLNNDNNRLLCEAFLQLHFCPPKPVTESDLSQVYIVPVDGEEIYIQMTGLIRVPFDQISSLMTIPAAGLESFEWKKRWLETYPATNDNTMMAVYMYRRIKGEV